VLCLCVDIEVGRLNSSPRELLVSGPGRLGDRWRLKCEFSVVVMCPPHHFPLGYDLVSSLSFGPYKLQLEALLPKYIF